MKHRFMRLFTALVLVSALAGASCSDTFDEWNTDKEHPPVGEADPCTLLEPILTTGANWMYDRSWRVHSELMQYTVDCGNSTRIQRYIFQASEFKTIWERFQRMASNADHMVRVAVTYEDPNAEAIALTLKTYFVSMLTDLYGDMPYTEAYRIDEGITQPVFDSQRDIYTAMIAALERANSLYDPSRPLTVPAKDLLYGGDMKRWRKFTCSLLMRLAMRLSNRPEMETAALMQRMLDNAADYPLFTSWQDDAKLCYTGVAPFQNIFGDMAESNFTGASHKCSARFISKLVATSDPRMDQWVVNPNKQDVYGVESGVVTPAGAGACILNSDVLKRHDSPVWLMTCAELQFILSEAAQRGMISGGDTAAEQYYLRGIAESVHQWDPSVSQSNIDKFIQSSAALVAYDGTLERIMEQKWLALFFQGFESWCDYRRTGLPDLVIGPDCENDGELPSRLQYPQLLVSTNRTHYDEQVARMRTAYPLVGVTTAGGDNLLTPVWWSRKAVEMENGTF